MPYLQQAFELALPDAVSADRWYVTLWERCPFYGGPEEGGWWGSDSLVQAYRVFPSEELAHQAYAQVLKLAQELERESKKAYGDQCLREMDWLEQRGLDADFLPEPDGPSEFYVTVGQEPPQDRQGRRGYE